MSSKNDDMTFFESTFNFSSFTKTVNSQWRWCLSILSSVKWFFFILNMMLQQIKSKFTVFFFSLLQNISIFLLGGRRSQKYQENDCSCSKNWTPTPLCHRSCRALTAPSETGGELSTKLPSGGLVEQMFLNTSGFSLNCFVKHNRPKIAA